MPLNRLLMAAGVFAFVVGLGTLLPATVLVRMAGVPPGVVNGVDGTFWQGSVRALNLGPVTVSPFRWTTRPWELLLGRLGAQVEGELPGGFIKGHLSAAFNGALAASDLELGAPLTALAPAAAALAGDSQLSARLVRVDWRAGALQGATGSVQLGGLVLPIPALRGSLPPGTYVVQFATPSVAPGQPLEGALADAGGPVEVRGTLRLSGGRNYEVSGTAKPRPGAPPELLQALRALGPAGPDGSHAFSLAGSL